MVLAAMLFSLVAAPAAAREYLSLGQNGDPGDGLICDPGGGSSSGNVPADAQIRPTVTTTITYTLAAPVVLLNLVVGSFVIFAVLYLPNRGGGGGR